MQPLKKNGCFFIDTTVLLSEILNENTIRLEKFKKNIASYNIPCLITDSVKSECEKKINSTLDFLGKIIKESIAFQLEDTRQKRNLPNDSPMTIEDMIVLEQLFSSLHNLARASFQLTSPIQIIEEWVIQFLDEEIKQGKKLGCSQFILELVKKLLVLTSSFQDTYDDLVTLERGLAKNIDIVPDASTIESLKELGIHEPDATHIACAFLHSLNKGQESIFVTFDYGSILSKRDVVYGLLKQRCCDPLYAIYYLLK